MPTRYQAVQSQRIESRTHRPYIAEGCDQQGRVTPTRMQPAECSTEIGADMPGRKVTREERIARRIEGAVLLGLAALLLTHFAAILFAA